MLLSKFSYYADYVAYPIVIAGLGVAGLSGADSSAVATWLGAGVAGLALWTFMEYVLHRVVLHRMPYFSPMHELHHTSPVAYIGTPTLLSVSVLLGCILAPTWYFSDLVVATGLTSGVMVGYVYYGLIHHIMHHFRNSPTHPYLNGLRAVHMRHHYSPQPGNFGVTTTFWDHVFGTVIRPVGAKAV